MIETLFIILIFLQIVIFMFSNLFYFYFSSKDNKIKPISDDKFSVALVIPCYNEEVMIERKLKNSFNLSRPKGLFKVYVVDDGSTDNTIKIAEEFKRKNQNEKLILLKYNGKKGKARALNWVFEKINEDIVVVTDVDVVLEKNALINLIENFSDPNVGAVNGKLLINKENKKFTTDTETSYRKLYDVWRRAESNLHSCSIFNGPLMAFRKKILEEVKINENTYSDDTDLLFKTIRLGYRAVYEPKAKFFESVDPSFLEQMKRKIRRATGLTHTFLENLNIIGKYGYFGKLIFPISFLIHIFFPILTLLSLLIFPLIVFKHMILLSIFLLLLIPIVRVTFIGFFTAQLALVLGLIMPRRGRWETTRSSIKNE
jgi:cellulose synthase/poly-beta-1,6-N-acetylglucosamine synthase-like glycosyltransferase